MYAGLPRPQEGSTALLVDLLGTVVEWAERTKVRIEDGAWEHAQKVLAEGRSGPGRLSRPRAGRAVVELFASFQQPVLVVLGRCTAVRPGGLVGASVLLASLNASRAAPWVQVWTLPYRVGSNRPKRAAEPCAQMQY